MKQYKQTIKEDATAFLKGIKKDFQADTDEHGGGSPRPNLALWLEKNGMLAKHVQKVSAKWTKKDLLTIKTNSRNHTPYGDPLDSAFGAYLKDILFELKKLMKKI